MGPIEAARACFSKYFQFSGRSSRPEFWWFLLVYLVVMALASFIDISSFGETVTTTVVTDEGMQAAATLTHRHRPAETIVWIIFFIPFLAAAWRRMQDTGRPGAVLLLPLVISLAAGAFLFLGILGFGLLEMIGLDGQFLRTLAASLGMAGIAVTLVTYIAMRILILWWLTRPSQKGPNQFGREPAA